jgi:hypothetical protein
MFIPDPDFYPSRIPDLGSRIPDPKTATKERGEKIFLSNIILEPQISQNVKYFYFLAAQEKNLGEISNNYGTFYPKSCH